jgi:Xaa-Pro aminopeptidase
MISFLKVNKNPKKEKLRKPMHFSLFCLILLCLPLFAQTPPPSTTPLTPLPTEELQERRSSLLEKLPPNSAFFLVRRPDNPEYQVPDKNFYYLSGTSDPQILMVLLSSQPPEEYLFLPPYNKTYELWNGKRLNPGLEAQKQTGFSQTLSIKTFSDFLKQLQTRPLAEVYYTPPEHSKDSFVWDQDIQNFLKEKSILPKSTRHFLGELRLKKSPYELQRLQKAIDLTSEGLIEAIRFAKPYLYEYELQGLIEYFFTKGGAQRRGFSSIIGSGPQSCVLHYKTNRRQILPDELVVMDVGAEFDEYTADITRTIPISGTFSPRQRKIYSLVLRAQSEAIAIIKPGVPFRMVDQTARKVIEEAGYGSYFLHSTSHWLRS